MNNEFEKLDAFMKKHAPPKKEVAAMMPVPPKNTHWIINTAMAFSLAVVVTGSVVYQRTLNYDENTLALSEVLEWDVTSDELPSHIEDVIALAD